MILSNGYVYTKDFRFAPNRNAAQNILDRFYDTEISRYTKKEEVKRILLERLSGATGHQ